MVVMIFDSQGLRNGNTHFPDENPKDKLTEFGFNTSPTITFDVGVVQIDVYERNEPSRFNLGIFLVFTTLGSSTKIVSCDDIFSLMTHLKPSLAFIKAMADAGGSIA